MAGTVIIGAGPAGLATAYELSKHGEIATILEADDAIGGLSRTVQYRGYRFDIGGHRFFSKVPIVNQIWHEILADDLLVRGRLSRIHYRNRFFDYPLKPANALFGLGPTEAMRVLLSYGRARLTPAAEPRSFEDWVAGQFGHRLYEIFFKTYTEKVWGIPCAEISADWADQRIKNLSLAEALRHAVLRRSRSRDGEVVTTLIDEFLYPRLGPGMMWERCAELLRGRGCDIVHGARVERIRHAEGRVRSVGIRQQDGAIRDVDVDQLISSMAVRELVQALDPAPPAAVLEAAAGLRYRDYQTVVLIVKRAQVFPDNWIYVHSPDVRLGRIQNYKNWSAEMVPDSSRTSLGLEYFLWDKDPEWTWEPDRLVEMGIRDCERMGLIDASEVEDGTIVRMAKAYPVYDHSYQGYLATIRSYLSTLKNLQMIGRNGQHRYNNQDHSMLTGIYAARNLLGDHHDVWAVNTERDYHEAGVSPRAVPMRLAPHAVGAHGTRPSEALVASAFAPLDPWALGVALATVAALVLLTATGSVLLRGRVEGQVFLELLGQFLPGFTSSPRGVLLGVVEAGSVGFVVGFVGARLRNALLREYGRRLRRRAAGEDMQGQV